MFVLSAFFAGIAGGLAAINYEIVTAETVSTLRSGAVLLVAYIGGIGFFFGPVIGAVVFTFFQTALSGFTKAWLLYLGLFFVAMVLFAPGGLASLLMHLRVWSRRAGSAVAALLMGVRPALVMTIGFVFLLEINYRLATKPELGTRTTFPSIPVDVARPCVARWAAGLGLVAAWPGRVRAAGTRWREPTQAADRLDGAPALDSGACTSASAQTEIIRGVHLATSRRASGTPSSGRTARASPRSST